MERFQRAKENALADASVATDGASASRERKWQSPGRNKVNLVSSTSVVYIHPHPFIHGQIYGRGKKQVKNYVLEHSKKVMYVEIGFKIEVEIRLKVDGVEIIVILDI